MNTSSLSRTEYIKTYKNVNLCCSKIRSNPVKYTYFPDYKPINLTEYEFTSGDFQHTNAFLSFLKESFTETTYPPDVHTWEVYPTEILEVIHSYFFDKQSFNKTTIGISDKFNDLPDEMKDLMMESTLIAFDELTNWFARRELNHFFDVVSEKTIELVELDESATNFINCKFFPDYNRPCVFDDYSDEESDEESDDKLEQIDYFEEFEDGYGEDEDGYGEEGTRSGDYLQYLQRTRYIECDSELND